MAHHTLGSVASGWAQDNRARRRECTIKTVAASGDLQEIAGIALKEATAAGCSDVSVLASRSDDSQVRFSNNSISLVNNVRNVLLDVYVAKDKKRIVGQTYNPTERGIKSFIASLISSCESLPPSEDHAPLPQGPFRYASQGNFDPRVAESNELVSYVKQAIDAGLSKGASRLSGSLNTESTELAILTSGGASGSDRQSKIMLNVRAFADDNASGHGLSCASYVSDFEPEKAGAVAGEYASRSRNPSQLPEGTYDVVFTSTVVANILPVARSASAFAIESGSSFLEGKLGQRVGVPALGTDDCGVVEHGLGGRAFDDEGTPTTNKLVVGEGVFRTMLHNTTTAKKFGSKSTGNAGIIAPYPFTIVFQAGGVSFEEMIRETRNGVLVTNNWYTRYQNQRTGEYSTVPRDAAFRLSDGEVREPLVGLRVSDSIPRQLERIGMISRERNWIKWWEVETPTLAPAMMIRGVRITRAVGS